MSNHSNVARSDRSKSDCTLEDECSKSEDHIGLANGVSAKTHHHAKSEFAEAREVSRRLANAFRSVTRVI